MLNPFSFPAVKNVPIPGKSTDVGIPCTNEELTGFAIVHCAAHELCGGVE